MLNKVRKATVKSCEICHLGNHLSPLGNLRYYILLSVISLIICNVTQMCLLIYALIWIDKIIDK